MKMSWKFSLGAVLLSGAISAFGAGTFPGNGSTGFGGAVGTGSISISDSLAGMTITLNRGAGPLNDALVLYLDTTSGGFTDTSLFSDNADGGRTAISGANIGNGSRTVASFPGLQADYAIAIENSFIGVFGLAAGGNGSLNFLFGQAQSGNNSDPSYSINISPAQMSQIGLTAGVQKTFLFVGSYISTSAYRANETVGASVTIPGDGSGNAGFNNQQEFTGYNSYQLVPEPSSAALLLLGAAGLFGKRRRK